MVAPVVRQARSDRGKGLHVKHFILQRCCSCVIDLAAHRWAGRFKARRLLEVRAQVQARFGLICNARSVRSECRRSAKVCAILYDYRDRISRSCILYLILSVKENIMFKGLLKRCDYAQHADCYAPNLCAIIKRLKQ